MYGAELAKIYDAVYIHGKAKDYAAEAATIAELVRARSPRADSLLDVACGTGTHLTHFRNEFARVAGVEPSEPMRRVARAKLPGVPIHAGDMRTFDLGVGFDAVTCLFSSIGYLRHVRELEAAAGRMAAHLKPGGVLIVEPWLTPDQWHDGHVSHLVTEVEGRTIVRMGFSSSRGQRTSRMHMHYLVGEPGCGVRHFTDHHDMTLFTAEEYEDAFALAGLTGISWVDGWVEGRDRLLARRAPPGHARVTRS